jgi:2-C-methyl-D-erythritol 4-phosphate cytidylyltransferase
MNFKAIITAGGSSNRFGKTNKLLEKIHSKEVIRHTVEAFLSVNEISEIIICANLSIIDELKGIFAGENRIRIIEGGKTRQQSVFNGLLAIKDCDYVLIHDGARPMITPEIIKKAIKAVQTQKALTVATKTIDTIKQVDENLKIIKTIDRSALYNTQTPQAFEYNLIKSAHEKLTEQTIAGGGTHGAPYGQDFTDDAGMLEYLGYNVYILEGDYKNIKITTQNDIEIAKAYL